MTPKISLITAVAVAALAIGVPAAFGEGGLAGSQEPSAGVAPDWFERAAAVQLRKTSASGISPDWFERAVAARQRGKFALQSSPVVVRDRVEQHRDELALQSSPEIFAAEETSRAAGRGIDWSQLGIGFGVGMFFVLGVILAVRLTRSRTLAH